MRPLCSGVLWVAGHTVLKPWEKVSVRCRDQYGHHDRKGENRWTILRRKTEREGTELRLPPAVALVWQQENKTWWPRCHYDLALWFSVAFLGWGASPQPGPKKGCRVGWSLSDTLRRCGKFPRQLLVENFHPSYFPFLPRQPRVPQVMI